MDHQITKCPGHFVIKIMTFLFILYIVFTHLSEQKHHEPKQLLTIHHLLFLVFLYLLVQIFVNSLKINVHGSNNAFIQRVQILEMQLLIEILRLLIIIIIFNLHFVILFILGTHHFYNVNILLGYFYHLLSIIF